MSYLRIAGAVAAVALLGFLWWRVSLSFSQGATIDAQAAQIGTLEAARQRDTRVTREISGFRQVLEDGTAAFRDELGKRPLTIKVAPHVDPKTGAVEPCVTRDAVRYRELYNRAVTGPPDLP